MRVYIRGANKKYPRKEMRDFVHWLGVKFLTPMQLKDTIVIIRNLTAVMANEEACFGSCLPVYEEGMTLPRRFEIKLWNQALLTRQKRTIAHEMRHVKHFRSGELEFGWTRWKKKCMISPNIGVEPWEDDADRAEKFYKEYEIEKSRSKT